MGAIMACEIIIFNLKEDAAVSAAKSGGKLRTRCLDRCWHQAKG
jgi:hypothetical protein